MADPVVEFRPEIGTNRYGKNQNTAVFEHTAHLAEGPPVILHVLNDVKGTNEIEGLIVEWQFADFPRDGQSAVRLQPLDHRRADVDKMRAGNRQPGPQTRADFQTRPHRWQ